MGGVPYLHIARRTYVHAISLTFSLLCKVSALLFCHRWKRSLWSKPCPSTCCKSTKWKESYSSWTLPMQTWAKREEITNRWSMEVIRRQSRPVKKRMITESKLELFCTYHITTEFGRVMKREWGGSAGIYEGMWDGASSGKMLGVYRGRFSKAPKSF